MITTEEPQQERSQQKAEKGPVLAVLLVVVLLSVLTGGVLYFLSRGEKPATKPAATTLVTSALVPMVDALTPASDSINYAFELDTQGDSIALRIPTIRGDTVIHYSGKGTLPFPHKTRVKGEVSFTSLTPGKQARVRIWRVVKIKQ